MTEQIKFAVTVDAKQATGAIANLRGEIVGMRDAIAQGRGIDHLGEQAKALQTKLAPAAAAISGVSAALGQQAGAAGQALNAVGQLTAAFGAGGAFGVAIAAAGVGVGAFTKQLERMNAAQDEAIAKNYAGVDAVAAQNQAMRAEIARMRREQGIDVDTPASIAAKAAADVEAVQVKIKAIRDESRTNLAASDEKRAAYKAEIALLTESIELIQRRANLATGALVAGSSSRPAHAARAARAPAAAAAEDPYTAWINSQGERDRAETDALAKLEEERTAILYDADGSQRAAAQASAEAAIAIEKSKQERLVKIRGEALDGAIAADREYWDSVANEGQAALGTLIGATNLYFRSWAEGSENSFQIASAMFLSSIGDQLVGIGVKQSYEGAGILIASAGLDPRGYGLLGTGSAAIAAGIGLGAAAGAVSASIPSGAGATSAAREPGASPRRDRSTGGGSDSLVVNVSYGVSGPLPEDTARAIAAAVGTSGRRGVA